MSRRRAQLAAVAVGELRRSLRGRRALPVWVLAAMPVLLGILWTGFLPEEALRDPGEADRVLGMVLYIFLLRLVFVFATAGVFLTLFRGEILDRTLHYLLLAPMRREELVLGKYLGGCLAAGAVLLPAMALLVVLFHAPYGVGAVLAAADQLVVFCGLAALAIIGYGAVFLLGGMLFRNAGLVVAVVLLWELGNAFMPEVLQRISVIHYLVALAPVPADPGPFAILADPPPAWVAVPGLLLVSAVLLAVAAWRARYLEVAYAPE